MNVVINSNDGFVYVSESKGYKRKFYRKTDIRADQINWKRPQWLNTKKNKTWKYTSPVLYTEDEIRYVTSRNVTIDSFENESYVFFEKTIDSSMNHMKE